MKAVSVILALVGTTCQMTAFDAKKLGKQSLEFAYGGAKDSVDVTVYYNLSKATISTISNQTFTGQEIEPEFIVNGYETKTTLQKDRDYKVTYSDNVNVGQSTVTIEGLGQYKGTASKKFTISQKSLSADDISVEVENQTFSGKQLKPVPAVKYGDKIVDAKDYTLTYGANINVGEGTDGGYVLVKARPDNNYTSCEQYILISHHFLSMK